jgi:hypothetical protein
MSGVRDSGGRVHGLRSLFRGWLSHGIGDRPFKVAALWAQGTTHGFVEALFGVLRFNGRSAAENGTNFRQVVYGGAGDARTGEAVDELLAFGPQVIACMGQGFDRVLRPLESRWGRDPRPVYLSPGGFDPPVVGDLAGRDPARRRRFLGDTNVSTTMTNAQLVLRYNAAFPAHPIAPSEAPQPSYDAFYMLAYAIYALGDATVTGPALSGAFQQLLPPGPKVDVGQAHILEGFEILRSSGRIDLNGAIGSLDFDPATGEAPIDYTITCAGIDDRGVASAGVDSGLFYDAREKRLKGTLHCP